MTKTIEFYFDFGSPTAFLAHHRLKYLAGKYRATISHVPMLLGGVFKAIGSTTPAAIPEKGVYMMQHDLPRFAMRYGIEMNGNPFFPINTLTLMRGAIAAQNLGCFDAYADAMFDGIWKDSKNLGDPEIMAGTLSDAGLDAQKLMEMTQEPEVKAALIANTEAAVARGVFGAPSMFLDSEFYFGQDRLDFIEEALAG